MKMHNLISILSFTFIVGCSKPMYQRVIGEYQWMSKDGYGSMSINFKSDSTFSYNSFWELGESHSEGNWKIENKKIMLNSHIQPNNYAESRLLESKKHNRGDFIEIQVLTEEGEKALPATCIVKLKNGENLGKNTNYEGTVIIMRSTEVDWIIISYLGYKTIRYPVTSTDDFYKFQLENELSYSFITDEQWTLRGKKLLRSDSLSFEPQVFRKFHYPQKK